MEDVPLIFFFFLDGGKMRDLPNIRKLQLCLLIGTFVLCPISVAVVASVGILACVRVKSSR